MCRQICKYECRRVDMAVEVCALVKICVAQQYARIGCLRTDAMNILSIYNAHTKWRKPYKGYLLLFLLYIFTKLRKSEQRWVMLSYLNMPHQPKKSSAENRFFKNDRCWREISVAQRTFKILQLSNGPASSAAHKRNVTWQIVLYDLQNFAFPPIYIDPAHPTLKPLDVHMRIQWGCCSMLL